MNDRDQEARYLIRDGFLKGLGTAAAFIALGLVVRAVMPRGGGSPQDVIR